MLYCSQAVTTFMYMYMHFMKNEAMNVINFGIAGCLLFTNEMKITKYPAKEKKRGQESKKKKRKKRRCGEKWKEKVKTVASLLNSKTILKFYFLRKSDLQKLIFCIRIRRSRSEQTVKGFLVSFSLKKLN